MDTLSILLQMLALISSLANCSYLTELYAALTVDVCGLTIDGFFQMAHPDWIIGTLLVPGTAILLAVFRSKPSPITPMHLVLETIYIDI